MGDLIVCWFVVTLLTALRAYPKSTRLETNTIGGVLPTHLVNQPRDDFVPQNESFEVTFRRWFRAWVVQLGLVAANRTSDKKEKGLVRQ
jgi:hypothetical protein